MDITKIVNDETESEGSAISVNGEVLSYLSIVVASLVVCTIFKEPISKVCECTKNVVSSRFESISTEFTLIKIGLINKVPSRLETVCAFDVIGKNCTFSEWVAALTLCE